MKVYLEIIMHVFHKAFISKNFAGKLVCINLSSLGKPHTL